MWNIFLYFISNAAALSSDFMMFGGAELESLVVVIASYEVLFVK